VMPVLRSIVDHPRRLFWSLQGAGWFGYFVLHLVEGTGIGPGQFWAYLRGSAATAFCGFVITFALRVGYARIDNLSPARLVSAVSVMLLGAAVIYGMLYAQIMFAWCRPACGLPTTLIGYGWYIAAMSYLLIAWTGLYFGIKFARQFQEHKEAALRARMMEQAAQLRMLRYQLNPHFLFNTLNSLSALMLDGKGRTASDMVESLGEFLRYSLDSDPIQRVTLAAEVDSIRQYLDIEQLRFTNRLRVHIDLSARTHEALVPSMILQPLVENAIKYAVAPREEGGRIGLEARRDHDMLDILLYDDGPGFSQIEFGSRSVVGVGLANTRERLKVLYGDSAHLTILETRPHGTKVHLRLPFETARVSR
jgi:two-component system LytT family sensor kinase